MYYSCQGCLVQDPISEFQDGQGLIQYNFIQDSPDATPPSKRLRMMPGTPAGKFELAWVGSCVHVRFNCSECHGRSWAVIAIVLQFTRAFSPARPEHRCEREGAQQHLPELRATYAPQASPQDIGCLKQDVRFDFGCFFTGLMEPAKAPTYHAMHW